MKVSIVALVGFAPLLITGCSPNVFLSPEEFVRRTLVPQCPTDTAPDPIEILESRHTLREALVFYHATCRSQSPNGRTYEVLGNIFVLRDGISWFLESGSAVSMDVKYAFEADPRFIEFEYANWDLSDRKSVEIVSGHILSPEVSLMQAVLDNGEILEDEGDGSVFVFFMPSDRSLRELRTIGQSGEVLQRDQFPAPVSLRQ